MHNINDKILAIGKKNIDGGLHTNVYNSQQTNRVQSNSNGGNSGFKNLGIYTQQKNSLDNQQNNYKPEKIGSGTRINSRFHDTNLKENLRKSSEDDTMDIAARVRIIQSNLLKLTQLVNSHDLHISETKTQSPTLSFQNSSFDSDSVHKDFLAQVNAKIESESRRMQNLLSEEIQKVRIEINNQGKMTNRRQLKNQQINLKKLQDSRNCPDLKTYIIGKEMTKDTERHKTKIPFTSTTNDSTYKEVDFKMHKIYEASRETFKQIQRHFLEIRQVIETLKMEQQGIKKKVDDVVILQNKQSFGVFEIHKKFIGQPQIIKYRQTLTNLITNISQTDHYKHKPSKEIILNQVIYYLDKEGQLLDSDLRYLIDHNNQYIRLSQTQLQLLHKNNLLN